MTTIAMKLCSVDDCGERHRSKGLCNAHYLRMRNHGSVDDPRPTLRQRVMTKIDFDGFTSSSRPDLGPCWLWTSSRSARGYPSLSMGGRAGAPVPAYRVVYELLRAPIPEGFELDHLCRNPLCVNPMHLEPVSHAENVRRGLCGILKTHCAKGHAWIPENIYTRRDGRRYCKVCHNEKRRAKANG